MFYVCSSDKNLSIYTGTVRPRKKGNPYIKLIFLKTVIIYFKKLIFTKFSLSSFFWLWHQLQDVLAMHGRTQTILNGDVKIYLRRIWI